MCLPRNEVEFQAEKLAAWMAKGRSAQKWLKSKGFSRSEKNLLLEKADAILRNMVGSL